MAAAMAAARPHGRDTWRSGPRLAPAGGCSARLGGHVPAAAPGTRAETGARMRLPALGGRDDPAGRVFLKNGF